MTKKSSGRKLKNAAIFCAAATLLVSSATPAHAYYNYAYGLGNLLWPVRALVYPLAVTPWSYRSPAYLASSAIQATARTAYRAPVVGNVYGNSLNYTEDQVAFNNNSNLLKVPQGTSDQINYVRWKRPTDDADRALLARVPGAPVSPAVQDGGFVPQGDSQGFTGQAPDASASGQQFATSGTVAPIGVPVTYGNQNYNALNPMSNQQAPLPAPPLKKGKKMKDAFKNGVPPQFQPNSIGQASAAMPNVPQHLTSPLAAHFIETVNTRFNGDVGQALKHSETRNLAEAMGLVDRKGFSMNGLAPERVDTISRIFKDSSLDPASKLDAMRILLRAPGATSPATAQSVERSF